MLRTIERTDQILKTFTLERPEWGITELAAELGWSTSTTHDLVSSLAEIGFLKKSRKRRYRVGWRVLELSHVVLGSSTLQIEARQGMEQFAAKYDETILLGVLAGGMVLYAEKIMANHFPISELPTPGGRFPAHASAAGKVLLAHLSAEDLQAIISEHGLQQMTPKSIQSASMLTDELERVEAQGHAYEFEESFLGYGSVAAPICDYSGQVVASLCVTAPIQQFERRLDDFRGEIVQTANQISRRLGHMAFTA